jgi:hypothetical protein
MRPVERRRMAGLLAIAAAIVAGFLLVTRTPDRASTAPPFEPGAPRVESGARPATALPPAEVAPSPASAPDAPAGGFLVRVMASGRPVPGAEVRLYRRPAVAGGARWEPAGAGPAGPDGTIFLAAPAGAHLVAASAPGLARAQQDAVRPSGEERTPVVIELTAAVSLSGRTVERQGANPVPFATVTVAPVRRGPAFRRPDLPPEERATATSDERGAFRITGLPAGRVEVEARAVGHAAARALDVAVPRGTELLLELPAAGVVEGVVTRDGRPVPGATVSILAAGEPVLVESGPAGGFAAEVEPGLHRAFARLGGATGTAGRIIAVAAGATVRGIEIRLGPSAAITGRVRSAAGAVRGASVVAVLHGDAGNPARATTGADGGYDIRGLAPGVHRVSISAPGYPSATVPGITLRAGDRFVLDVLFVPPSVVEGTVTDMDGRPVSGALVSAEGQGMRGPGPGNGAGAGAAPPLAARTGADGRYRIEGVSPGPFRVSARKDASSPAALKIVTVEEGETVTADLSLVEGGVVAGAVVDPAGNPVPGAMIWTSGGGGPPRPGEARQAAADASGAFLLALPPGTYSLGATRPRSRFRFAGRPAALATVQLVAGQRAEVSLVLPEDPAPTITGRVLEPGAVPSAGAIVWVGAPGAGLQATQADPEGTFSLSSPGTTPVQVNARSGGRTGSVEAMPPAVDLLVQLQPAATVRGRLVGEPPPETFSVAVSQRTSLPGGGTPEQQFANASFDLEDVAPGQISLHVKTADGRMGDAQVTLAAGESRSADVVLSPACTVTGRLVDAATGKPVTRARILVDGVASRRYGVDPAGRFTRITSEGEHQVNVAAIGYAPRIIQVKARSGAPVDLGDVPMTPASPPAGTR